jgi:hypothetical protein
MAVSKLVPVAGGVTQKVSEFTTTGSFTAPANVTTVEVFLVGGGAGGGSATAASGQAACGGGGGGGTVNKRTITVVPGTTYTVTIGAGGAGSTNVASAGVMVLIQHLER